MLNFFNKIFRKASNLNAHHISEYSLLIVCVMAGILITGPYVVRSWNALLKSFDTDMRDSFTDPLMQAPTTGLECRCDDWKQGECGVTYLWETCKPMERMEYRICFPFGCENDISKCNFDSTCCQWENIKCGPTSLVPDGADCPIGLKLQGKDCNQDGVYESFQCVNDSSCIICDGIAPWQLWKENECPGAYVGLVAPLPWMRVPDILDCGDGKCKSICHPPYEPSNDSSYCKCPDGQVDMCSAGPPILPDTIADCCKDACDSINWQEETLDISAKNVVSSALCGPDRVAVSFGASNKFNYYIQCSPLNPTCFAGAPTVLTSQKDIGTPRGWIKFIECPQQNQVITGIHMERLSEKVMRVWGECKEIIPGCLTPGQYNFNPLDGQSHNNWFLGKNADTSPLCYYSGFGFNDACQNSCVPGFDSRNIACCGDFFVGGNNTHWPDDLKKWFFIWSNYQP